MHFFRSSDVAEELVDEIQSSGGRAVAIGADLGAGGAPSRLIKVAEEQLGPLTCLVNNASVFERDTVLTATRATWDQHMDVNLRAPFELAQAFVQQLPNAVEAKRRRSWLLHETATQEQGSYMQLLKGLIAVQWNPPPRRGQKALSQTRV